jgi:hypothetical protein
MTLRTKKPKAAPPFFQRGREFKVILPEDISERIEMQAKAEGKPQSRIIINDLARIPDLDERSRLEELVGNMDSILARYAARIISADLTDDLLRTLREMVKADDANNIGLLRAKVAKVRVILAEMEKHERDAKEK